MSVSDIVYVYVDMSTPKTPSCNFPIPHSNESIRESASRISGVFSSGTYMRM